ncbi:ABC transporter ATP-binding protein [Arcanobacterium phocisimile]|uniref:ABC transporter ATP-binding protein n=1 Tax=Arcanobacterium phocisimile TaxID=1302235 RepID=A0ABX7IHQ0_9ACTO|nr:ABC transporter ATP-binding protein [Arcanobacterium phocisimile]QRV01640.1 ABC transporter ATP-binding protein [Arcanobacterium phocisimile]
MEPTTPLILIEGLTKRYASTTALADVSLDLHPGKVIGLIGNNGSGKTTLMKILAGVLSDWEGTVRIAGYAPSPKTKKRLAFLPSAQFLNKTMTAGDACRLYARFFTDFDIRKAHDLLDYFDLPLDKKLKEMSKGMNEKVQVSLTMSRNADIYLLDEPISGVDPATRSTILNGILRDFSPEALMVLSTHLVADVEAILDDVILINNGKVARYANVDDLREEYGMSLDSICRKGLN